MGWKGRFGTIEKLREGRDQYSVGTIGICLRHILPSNTIKNYKDIKLFRSKNLPHMFKVTINNWLDRRQRRFDGTGRRLWPRYAVGATALTNRFLATDFYWGVLQFLPTEIERFLLPRPAIYFCFL